MNKIKKMFIKNEGEQKEKVEELQDITKKEEK